MVTSALHTPGRVRRPCYSRLYRSLAHLVFTLVLAATSSCTRGPVERPAGYFKAGPISNFALGSESNLSEIKIALRRDERGFSAMSTSCTFDGSPLSRVRRGAIEVWESSYSESVYDQFGKVLHGPAVYDLPYFDLRVDSGSYGGPLDTLYVHVGVMRPSDWRLAVP